MAKGQTNASTGAANTLINQANTVMPGVVSGIGSDKATSDTRAAQTFGGAQSGYNQQQVTGGYDPQQLALLRSDLSGMQATGGVDPTQLANIRSNLAGMQTTGGYDPTQLAQTLSGYGTMADTGGFSGADRQNFLNQATSGTTSLASNLASAAQRNAAATGGNAGAAIADIQRQGGQQAANATTGALTSLNQQVNANKLAGLGGLSSTEAQLAAARQGVAGAQAGLEQGVAGLRQGVSGMQSGLESNLAANRNAANTGLAGLYSTAQGASTAAQQQALQGLGLQFGTEAQGAQILQELSKNPGLFQTGFSDIVSLLGVL